MKYGRNEPCWCGSGKKYKKCHYNRTRKEKPRIYEPINSLQRALKVMRCMASTHVPSACSGRIIGAHTVSRCFLKNIAENGHVISPNTTPHSTIKNNGESIFEKIGINKASVFNGFCQTHDKQLFAVFEDNEFHATDEQCFMLAYRSICRELYNKMQVNNLSSTLRDFDKGESLITQKSFQDTLNQITDGANYGLRDLITHKNNYDKVFQNKCYSELRSYVYEINRTPPIMASVGFFPCKDFDGIKIQDLRDKKVLDFISINIFGLKDKGYLVFSWLSNSDNTCQHFVDTFDKTRNKTESIVSLLSQYCENLYINPQWWDSQNESVRSSISARLNDHMYERPIIETLGIDDWNISNFNQKKAGTPTF